ncbi:metal ABC transporter solute-binding protein, Zn/Mn family [Pseudogemmobacter sonorensis]|uniref:metal ABC transporter solute-binding protein, Zn/Mn family n=1 Tax=Pseudogemmobacter sonorensis TaxID=2989681 RepID=UPI003687C9ED
MENRTAQFVPPRPLPCNLRPTGIRPGADRPPAAPLAAAMLAAALVALPATGARAETAPTAVLGTVGMISDIAARIGGDCVAVSTFVGRGADPHLFTPAPSDLRKLRDAGILLYGGLNLEGQLGEVLERLSQGRPVLAVSELGVVPEDLLRDGAEPDPAQPDPHVWMDPDLWAGIVPVIAGAISEARPDCAQTVMAGAIATEALLAELDAWAAASIATIPEAQRNLVTTHDAFGYFGRAYGIEVTAIQGVATPPEAAIADIEAVAALVAEVGVPAVFVESTINPRTIQALIEAVAARGGAVGIGGELFADAMGAAGTPEDTYPGMVVHNVSTITRALGGAPVELPKLVSQAVAP